MQTVLHKNKDLHIGHVLASSDSAEHPRFIGVTCLSLGFLAILLYISIITFAVGLAALFLAQKHHRKFINKMGTYAGARESLQKNERA